MTTIAPPLSATLLNLANTANPPDDRQKSINGILHTAADAGRFEAKFLREEYPDSDFGTLAADRRITISRDEVYTYVRWSGTLPTGSTSA